MKKKILSLTLILILVVLSLIGCQYQSKTKSAKGSTKVVLNEVAHSIFYAPMYVAIESGYFAEEGLDVELVTGYGADKTMTALLSGEADIGFMGPEASKSSTTSSTGGLSLALIRAMLLLAPKGGIASTFTGPL